MPQGDHGAGDVAEAVSQAVSAVDIERVRQGYWDQNACVFFERFLPPEVVRQFLVPEVERLRPAVHRNYIPGHKKGGSISSFTLTERAPVFRNLYRSAAFMEFGLASSAVSISSQSRNPRTESSGLPRR